jgi:glycerophosphoryl diester phosphodiesterase
MFRQLGTAVAAALVVLALHAPPVDASTVVVVGHRGASAYAPENTIASFDLAHDQGADVFELDVQESKDHQLVIMHDATLGRTTNAETVFPGRSPWNVRDLTLAEIRRLDAGSWVSARYDGERVPTLGQTLDDMSGSGLGLLLEIKNPELYPGMEKRIADELRRNRAWLSADRVAVQSFSWASVRRFHALLPQVPTALLGTPATSQLASLKAYADQINPPYTDVTADYVQRVHHEGMRVFAWTVNDPAVMHRMIAYGVDGIISNQPGTLRDVVAHTNA